MITVLYTCHSCGLDKAKAFVRDRRKVEDVTEWMVEVGISVCDAHSLASPGCTGRHADILIPLSTNPDSGVGYKT